MTAGAEGRQNGEDVESGAPSGNQNNSGGSQGPDSEESDSDPDAFEFDDVIRAGASETTTEPDDSNSASPPETDSASTSADSPEPEPAFDFEVIEAGSTASASPSPSSPTAGFQPSVRWSGYIDVGFFDVQGNGAGHAQDTGHVLYPEHSDVAWVFYGDPLSTAVNSRGEPGDTGDASNLSRAIRFDSVDSKGKPTFLVNEVNLDMMASMSPSAWALVSVDLMPRGRNISDPEGNALGDFFEVDLAFANWTAYETRDHDINLQVGKFDPVMGLEYRIQESPDRFGVTPSLIFRYLGGRPTGVRGRMRLWNEKLSLALAVTNGSSFVESFPFFDEQDSNAFKTVTGRLGSRLSSGGFAVELGASGLVGAQDQQEEFRDPLQWQVGGDLNLVWRDLELRAEYTRGRAPGSGGDCDLTPCLRFQGAYGQLAYRLLNYLGVYGRVDWRDADHRSGSDFLYIVDSMRGTVGARIEPNHFSILKIEYIRNLELQGRPEIANDVLTSSLVLKL